MKTKDINREKVSYRKKKGDTMDKYSKLRRLIKEAQKDPIFIRDINKFIKITTGVYKLKDYGLDKLK